MSDIRAVFPPLSVSRDFIDYPYFANLGLLQAAALLREAGHTVTITDALATRGAGLAADGAERIRLGVPVEALDLEPGFQVAIVALTPFHCPPQRDRMLGEVLEALRQAEPDARIILADLYQSGQHVVDVPSAELAESYPEADAILRYEAEDVLCELVTDLTAGGRPPQTRLVDGNEVRELDGLPLPAWDAVDVEAYFGFLDSVVQQLGRPQWAFPIDQRSLPMLSTRGCPFRCAHCSSNAGIDANTPKRQRRYSEAYLDRALDQAVSVGARRIHFLDELANVNERHFDRLLEQLSDRDLRFEFPNGVRADYVLPRHLEAMKGKLTTLSVSAESGVQRVVDEVVGKDLDLTTITETARRAQSAGVPMLVHFMIGMPGETRAEINGTLDFAIKLFEETGAWPSVQFATPLPGTRLARMAADGGKRALPVVRDWGPHFQGSPTIESDEFSHADLIAFKRTFDLRIEAAQGAKKIIMNVTYKCNNRCTFCAVGTRTQFDGDYDRQRELLIKYRKQGVTLLDFDGGEPTLNPKLFSLIRFARQIGYQKVNVTTNGRMCTYEPFAKKLVTSGITTLLFSIHGHNRAIHAANVGVPEAFDQTIDGLKLCMKHGGPGLDFGANLTLTKSNYKHQLAICELLLSLNIKWLNVQFLTPFGRATNTVNPDTQLAANETMRAIDKYGDRIKFCVINLPACFMPGYEDFVLGDLLKLERHMLFVNSEEVNLFEYLREQRRYEAVCDSCVHRNFCGGFYIMDDVPEPEWLIEPQDLVRPIAARGLTAHPTRTPDADAP